MKTNKNGILLAGMATEEVTGSMYLVQWEGYNILLECGMYQSNKDGLLEAYKVNNAKLPIPAKEIDFIFWGHAHIDHTGLTPRIFKEGGRPVIFTTSATARIAKHLLYNSAYILNKEASRLSKQFGRVYEPVYTKDDVDTMFNFVEYCDEIDKVYTVNDEIRFQWLKNGHCLGATQLQLILGHNGNTRKVLYTSDLGAFNSSNHFVTETEKINFHNNVVLGETTYGATTRAIKRKRQKELELIEGIIRTTVANKGTVVLPVFAFAKLQELVISLYEMFKDDPTWKTKIYVDTMLGVDICREYQNILDGEDRVLWNKALSWENIELVHDFEQSEVVLANDHSKIVLSASGFATNGRVINHIKKVVKDQKNTIILTGYPGVNDTYLAHKLKSHKNENKINIDGVVYPYRANLHTMDTFSSHMDHNELVKYYGSLRADTIVFVHGDMDGRYQLKEKVEEERSKNNMNSNIIVPRKDTFIPL